MGTGARVAKVRQGEGLKFALVSDLCPEPCPKTRFGLFS